MPSIYDNTHHLKEHPGSVPIAICGIGMRLPGGIRDPKTLYEFLFNKGDARRPAPPDRYTREGFYNAQGKSGSPAVQQGYWLDDVDLSHFDSSLFSTSLKEIESLDPHQRLLLEVVRETLESAAETGWRGKNVGCYVGSFGEDWSNLRAKDAQHGGFAVATGYMDLFQANRISYEYDLRGPSMTLRAGCSASGLGIHLACQSIQLGESSSAIVAGVNIILTPETTALLASGDALSPDVSCKTFDANVNGYARADGVNCLYIKRLDEAIREGNPIRAVIRATSSNAGGRSTGLTVPNVDAQEALIRAAYCSGGLESPALTAMVECHGTGTVVGDVIEAATVARVFGDAGVYIGSVKPNLGHSEGAAAITSVIKAVVELENRTLLPNIKFKTPNPKIPWDEARLTVPTEPTTWPEGRPERISINSYGIGGSNVHIILDSAASFGLSDVEQISKIAPDFNLMLLSAGHPDSLHEMQKRYQEYAATYPDRLTSLAYTLSHRREQLQVRGFCITRGGDDKVFSPPFTSQSQKQVAFIFTGQGAQWPQMGKELLQTYPEVMRDIREMDQILLQQTNAPRWTLEQELLKPADTSSIAEAEIAQPVNTALQIALYNLLSRWNVSPVAVIGHSSGEIAAAYVAGSLSMHDAILLAYYRGAVLKAQTRVGAMAAVGLSYDEVAKWLKPGVVIACENSPVNVTLSGDTDALESVLSTLQLENPQAYHSQHMQEIGHIYERLIATHLKAQTPIIPFFSTVASRQLHESEDFGPCYWRQNLESPVWFNQGFNKLLCSEIGRDAIYLEICRAQNASNTLVSFLSCMGELYSLIPRALHDLPLYPWHHAESRWSESRSMKASRFRKFPHHELLGVRTIESSDLEPVWRNTLRLGEVPWLRDHCVGSDIIFPAAAYIAMAGHAVWQITGLDDYTVRDVSFKTAMVLDEALPTEILAKLEPHRLTNTLNSNIFKFSIQSYNGSVWAQHSSGLVVGGQASPGPKPTTVTTYSRVVESRRWYRAMRKVGLRFGPCFTGLDHITASVNTDAASAVIQDNGDIKLTYPLHPTTIDSVLQSALVAINRGQPQRLKHSMLPTLIEEMYIRGANAGQNIHVNTSSQKHGLCANGVTDDTLVFYLKGLEFSALDGRPYQPNDQLETAQLVWKPHLEFVDPRILIKPTQKDELSWVNPLIERIFILCIMDLVDDIVHIPPPQGHLNAYRTWISRQLVQIRNEGNSLVSDAKDLFALSADERKRQIKTLVAGHTEGTLIPASRLLLRCYSHMLDIFKDNIDPLELLRQDDLLGQFYDCVQNKHEYKDLLQLLGHVRPQMNILEIGAGTGGLTAQVLDFLLTESGEELYREYTFTDISTGFFASAKERFRDCPRVQYAVLDISKDPVEQGFPVGHYDLIIASNVLHATPLLTRTLEHIKTLLRPDGRLLLQELCPTSNWVGFIFGLFPGWWLGKDDGRASQPYISPKEWDARLRDAGFTGVDASALDADNPYQLNAMIVARPSPPVFEAKRVTLLLFRPSAVVDSLHRHLISNGYEVDIANWGEDLPAVQKHSTSNFLWVTHAAQIRPQDPRFALVLGMARTLRSELGISFITLEMQDFGPGFSEAVLFILRELQQRAAEHAGVPEFDPDQEFAWANGEIHVSRMHWFSIPEALTHRDDSHSPASLEIGQHGLLNTLRWVSRPMRPLQPHEVRIQSMSVSLNFHDLLVAMGVIPGYETQELGGGDSAGVVTAIGCHVTNVSVGDRVMAFSDTETSYATEVQLPSKFCIQIPDNCSFEDASTLSTVYFTVLRALRDKAKLRHGQTVLIHSAAGGVGIAAIHYARWVGATIYATVSSPEKTTFLVETMGVLRENVFYSRDNTFLAAVMSATDSQGVDVVLNSLSGEQLHASWQCVAEGGTMVEIGKRDLLGRAQLAMHPFLANRSYIGVDIATLRSYEPDWVQQQLKILVDLYKQGIVHSIHPIQTFPAHKIEDAFRHLQKGQHMGKSVVQFSGSSPLTLSPKIKALELRADKAYLLVGGMRGIGASLARWMVDHGAKRLVFLSRTAGERNEDRVLVRELSDMGCQCQTFSGDVTDLATVQRLVSSVAVPIAGVTQLAMVLADIGVMSMDIERWNAAVTPKVNGTWNLHEALPIDMDFFVMASSVAGIFGQYGQSNYASANAFLDAFAQFRQSRGLAASTVDLGAVDEIGYVGRNAIIRRQVVQQLGTTVSEESLLNSFHLAIVRSRPSHDLSSPFRPLGEFRAQSQLLHGILSKAGVNKRPYIWARDIRTALSRVHQKNTRSTGDSSESQRTKGGLNAFLSLVQDNPEILNDEPTVHIIAKSIARQVSTYTMRGEADELDLTLSLMDCGVDSLVSIELRNWWRQEFGADVTVLQLTTGGSFMNLGQRAVNQLKQRYLKV
ncbi:putative polyketide synthase [Xylaria arbuscula]|nr:putative polyketide synthase [Xylaria arbuscula]